MCDRLIEIHNALSPALTKLELLSRLSPALDSDKDYAATLGTILDMMGDYIAEMRRTLDALAEGDS